METKLGELGLWSILTRANVVKKFEQSFDAQITPSDSNCVYALSPSYVDKTNIVHKIETNLNHGTCIQANDVGSENAIKTRHKY